MTHYSIFMKCDGPIEQRLRLLSAIDGVSVSSSIQIEIAGLSHATCVQLDETLRATMREDYGEFGLDLNWELWGRSDEWDPCDRILRLYRCAAEIVNAFPNDNCSLMRNGESFYLFNSHDRLIVAPTYLEALPQVIKFFRKPLEIATLEF